ncbi:MAG: hypothetical protein HY902_09975 [Deltaproteobacteria bacterium]|nr:hypothetical protein [Deltaproteobacteria bacterium]
MDPLDVARLIPQLLLALQAVQDAAAARDRPFLSVATADRQTLQSRVDLQPLGEAWLRNGTPVEPIEVGEKRVLVQPYALLERLAPRQDWPRHLLPIGTVGPQGLLALDQHSGQVVEVTGETVVAQAEPLSLLGDLSAWLTAVAPGQSRRIRAYFALALPAAVQLEQSLGPQWRERWLFQGLMAADEVRAQLLASLHLNRRIARVCTVLTAAAPLLGWWLGQVATPEHPWQGVALALLVVGGVPGWLWAQARREVVDLHDALRGVGDLGAAAA